MRVERSEQTTPESGFALVAVMLITTLLAVVAFTFTASVRAYIRTAESGVAAAEAEALADAGANLGILRLVREGPSRAATAAADFACGLPDGSRIAVRTRDEAGKVDLNAGKNQLLLALFTGAGLTPEVARSRLEALADFKDADTVKNPRGAERDEYVTESRANGPKNAPMAAIEELAGVVGFDAGLVGRLRPYVTVHSEQDGIDPSAVSPELAELLVRGDRESNDGVNFDFERTGGIPRHLAVASVKRVFNVTADVTSPRGARFVREAVLSLVDASPGPRTRAVGLGPPPSIALPYRIWRWRRGEDLVNFGAISTAELPPC